MSRPTKEESIYKVSIHKNIHGDSYVNIIIDVGRDRDLRKFRYG